MIELKISKSNMFSRIQPLIKFKSSKINIWMEMPKKWNTNYNKGKFNGRKNEQINHETKEISKWAVKWKMNCTISTFNFQTS